MWCIAACQRGYYGVGCQQRCQCISDVPCDAETGVCVCPAGRTGPRCELRAYRCDCLTVCAIVILSLKFKLHVDCRKMKKMFGWEILSEFEHI